MNATALRPDWLAIVAQWEEQDGRVDGLSSLEAEFGPGTRYSFDASVERTTTRQDAIVVQAEKVLITNSALTFITNGEIVATFAANEWNCATEVEQP